MDLASFNALPESDADVLVATWAAIPSWVEQVVAGRPYVSERALEHAALTASRQWSVWDLDAALAHHPRIGARVSGKGAEAAASRREQSSMAGADAETAELIAAGNRDYEEQFGRVFLVRAAGRSPQEMLAELQRRLGNDPETETEESLEQLRQIALLRLRGALGVESAEGSPAPQVTSEHPHLTTHILDATTGRPASDVAVTLTGPVGEIATGTTDDDGRLGLGPDLLPRATTP